MKCYLQIKKLHSEKKNKDYTSIVLNLGGRDYFISLPLEAQGLILNKSLREVLELQVGYESKKFEFDIED